MANLAAFILAGGQGKRMGVLCRHRAKPALPFAGKYRVIDFALSNCLNSDVRNVAVLTDYQSSPLTAYLRRWHLAANDQDLRLDVLEAKTHYLGTADAVFQNREYLKSKGIDSLLVLAADHVYNMDYRPMLAFHELSGADVTVGVVSMPRQQARHFGTVTVDSNNRIIDFAEKADHPSTDLVSMGIYIFSVKTLIDRLSEDACDSASPHDFGYRILPRAVTCDSVFAYRFDGFWRDIGTIEAYHRANIDLACGRSPLNIDMSWPVVTANTLLPKPCLAPGATVHNSILSPGCHIMGYVENSVVGYGVCIEEHAVVRNSVLMDNVFVGERSVVQSSIIDEGVSLGRCTEIIARDRFSLEGSPIAVMGKDSSPLHPLTRPDKRNPSLDNIGDLLAVSPLPEPSAEPEYTE